MIGNHAIITCYVVPALVNIHFYLNGQHTISRKKNPANVYKINSPYENVLYYGRITDNFYILKSMKNDGRKHYIYSENSIGVTF